MPIKDNRANRNMCNVPAFLCIKIHQRGFGYMIRGFDKILYTPGENTDYIHSFSLLNLDESITNLLILTKDNLDNTQLLKNNFLLISILKMIFFLNFIIFLNFFWFLNPRKLTASIFRILSCQKQRNADIFTLILF